MIENKNNRLRVAALAAAAALVLAVSLGVASPGVFGHGGATGIVKQRMDAMEVMGKAMKAVGAMFKGQAEYDPAAIEAAAGLLAQHARDIPMLFPDSNDSRHGKATDALPAIWEQKERFDGLAADMLRESQALSSIAGEGENRAVRLQFAKTGKVCSACHTAFRKPQE